MKSVTIQLTKQAQETLRRFERFPTELGNVIAYTMDEENQFTIAHISEKRLTGQGPFPPSQGRLGVRTGQLRRSLRANKAEVIRNVVSSSIGTNVRYAGMHEFGFTGSVVVPAHRRRVKSRDVIERVGKRRVKTASGVAIVREHTRNVRFPERAPIRRGIEDRAPEYGTAVSNAIVNLWDPT